MSRKEDLLVNFIEKIDEAIFYSFLTGFGLGLLYFLVLVSNSKHSNFIDFYVTDTYYITLFILVFWFIFTIVNYIVYAFSAITLDCFANFEFKKEYPKGFTGLSAEAKLVLSKKEYDAHTARYPHLYGLITSSLLVLMPYPFVLFKFHEVLKKYCVDPLFIMIFIGLLALLFAAKIWFPHYYRSFIINKKIELDLIIFTQ